MRTRATLGGRRHLRHVVIGAALLFLPGALTAPASAAPTLTVNRPCYVDLGTVAAQMVVVGTGFTGGDPLTLTSSDGSVHSSTTVAPNGAILVSTDAPVVLFTRPGAKTVTLTATDYTTAGTTTVVTTSVAVTTLAALPNPPEAPLTQKVTWYFSGFAPGKYVYGHYLRRNQVARARFGRAQGPCGLLRVRARFYPGGHPRYSRYKVQFDDSKRYSRSSLPRYVLDIKKTLIF